MKQTNRRDPRNRIDFLMMLMFLMHLKIHTTFCKKQISSLMYLNESRTTDHHWSRILPFSNIDGVFSYLFLFGVYLVNCTFICFFHDSCVRIRIPQRAEPEPLTTFLHQSEDLGCHHGFFWNAKAAGFWGIMTTKLPIGQFLGLQGPMMSKDAANQNASVTMTAKLGWKS